MPSPTETIVDTSHHLYPLISDLGLILMTAGVAVLLFKKIRQPLVLGYLIAGFLAGPHFSLFPTIQDLENVEVWAEIGVIILLFSLGLEFSFKKLMKVGGSASITATVQIISMIFLGYFTAQLMGWSQMDSIFLGAILSMSSTTIILRAFDELGVKGHKFASIVFGTLIIEDIVAILLMVLLSTIAVSQQFSGAELLESVLKLIFFLILWFVGGIFFIPTLLKRTKNLLNDETMLIVSLALCLMMVILATKAGFSPALGAFIMGSIIAETTRAEQIEHLIKPVKDLFGAVFFVSVGMLINLDTLREYAIPVVIITLITIVGKSLSTTLGSLLSAQPLKQSVQAGMSLAQIGEFSFIIATLGMTLKVTSDFVYPIIVAVSAVTTFTTPFFIKISIPTYNALLKILPLKWVEKIESYSANTQTIKSTNHWKSVFNANIIQIVIHSVIIIAIIILSSKYFIPMADSQWKFILFAFLTLMVLAPFLWALALQRVGSNAMEEIKKDRKYRHPIILISLFRIGLAIFYVGILLNKFLSPLVAVLMLGTLFLLGILFPKKLQRLYSRLENHFLKNLNSREISEAAKNKSDLTPWDGHMTTFEIAQESTLVGKTLADLKFRETLGVNIAIIKRGDITINVPTRDEIIFPKDVIYVIGTDEQVATLKKHLDENVKISEDYNTEIILQKIELTNEDFIGKSIRDTQIKERTNGIIAGIERNGIRIINPESTMVLEQKDIIWLVGDKVRIKTLFP
jgi:CPA2 family monovalent cation:H+ antiporter-2